MEPVPDMLVAAPASHLASVARGVERTFGYAVMAGAVVAAEILVAAEALLRRSRPVWR
jgi:hypothetical protein